MIISSIFVTGTSPERAHPVCVGPFDRTMTPKAGGRLGEVDRPLPSHRWLGSQLVQSPGRLSLQGGHDAVFGGTDGFPGGSCHASTRASKDELAYRMTLDDLDTQRRWTKIYDDHL